MGKAYVDGFRQVLKHDYEYILQMDADLSHDPAHLPRFMEQIQTHDLVVGSRYLTGHQCGQLGLETPDYEQDGDELCALHNPHAVYRHDQRLQVLATDGARSNRLRKYVLERIHFSWLR